MRDKPWDWCGPNGLEKLSRSKVVELKPHTITFWQCKCGCKNFRLIEGGDVDCADCGLLQGRRHFDPEEQL
jgi:hypothetical protein